MTMKAIVNYLTPPREMLFAAIVSIIAGLVYAAFAWAGNCHHFFQPVQQVVAVPQVYYATGQDLQVEALAEKIAARVEQKLALRASVRQPVTSPEPAKSAIAVHCSKCHSGDNPKGKVVYDGGQLTCFDITRALRAIASNKMPKDHQIDNAVKGALMEELLGLERPSGPSPPIPQNPDLE